MLARRQRDRLAVGLEADGPHAQHDRLPAHARAGDEHRILTRCVGQYAHPELFDEDIRTGYRFTSVGGDGAANHRILRQSRTRAGHEQRQYRSPGEENATTILEHGDTLT